MARGGPAPSLLLALLLLLLQLLHASADCTETVRLDGFVSNDINGKWWTKHPSITVAGRPTYWTGSDPAQFYLFWCDLTKNWVIGGMDHEEGNLRKGECHWWARKETSDDYTDPTNWEEWSPSRKIVKHGNITSTCLDSGITTVNCDMRCHNMPTAYPIDTCTPLLACGKRTSRYVRMVLTKEDQKNWNTVTVQVFNNLQCSSADTSVGTDGVEVLKCGKCYPNLSNISVPCSAILALRPSTRSGGIPAVGIVAIIVLCLVFLLACHWLVMWLKVTEKKKSLMAQKYGNRSGTAQGGTEMLHQPLLGAGEATPMVETRAVDSSSPNSELRALIEKVEEYYRLSHPEKIKAAPEIARIAVDKGKQTGQTPEQYLYRKLSSVFPHDDAVLRSIFLGQQDPSPTEVLQLPQLQDPPPRPKSRKKLGRASVGPQDGPVLSSTGAPPPKNREVVGERKAYEDDPSPAEVEAEEALISAERNRRNGARSCSDSRVDEASALAAVRKAEDAAMAKPQPVPPPQLPGATEEETWDDETPPAAVAPPPKGRKKRAKRGKESPGTRKAAAKDEEEGWDEEEAAPRVEEEEAWEDSAEPAKVVPVKGGKEGWDEGPTEVPVLRRAAEDEAWEDEQPKREPKAVTKEEEKWEEEPAQKPGQAEKTPDDGDWKEGEEGNSAAPVGKAGGEDEGWEEHTTPPKGEKWRKDTTDEAWEEEPAKKAKAKVGQEEEWKEEEEEAWEEEPAKKPTKAVREEEAWEEEPVKKPTKVKQEEWKEEEEEAWEEEPVKKVAQPAKAQQEWKEEEEEAWEEEPAKKPTKAVREEEAWEEEPAKKPTQAKQEEWKEEEEEAWEEEPVKKNGTQPTSVKQEEWKEEEEEAWDEEPPAKKPTKVIQDEAWEEEPAKKPTKVKQEEWKEEEEEAWEEEPVKKVTQPAKAQQEWKEEEEEAWEEEPAKTKQEEWKEDEGEGWEEDPVPPKKAGGNEGWEENGDEGDWSKFQDDNTPAWEEDVGDIAWDDADEDSWGDVDEALFDVAEAEAAAAPLIAAAVAGHTKGPRLEMQWSRPAAGAVKLKAKAVKVPPAMEVTVVRATGLSSSSDVTTLLAVKGQKPRKTSERSGSAEQGVVWTNEKFRFNVSEGALPMDLHCKVRSGGTVVGNKVLTLAREDFSGGAHTYTLSLSPQGALVVVVAPIFQQQAEGGMDEELAAKLRRRREMQG